MAKIFGGTKTAKLGTEKRPAIVRVQTEEKMKEVAAIFEENGWKFTLAANDGWIAVNLKPLRHRA
jgi:hypothetical protein